TRAHRLLFGHGAGDLFRRSRPQVVRTSAGYELVENDAERVDVGARGERVAAHLLRTRVLRRHQPKLAGDRNGDRTHPRIQQLGDTEIKELDDAVVGDKDVRRLEVAMDDEIPVRVVHGFADGLE